MEAEPILPSEAFTNTTGEMPTSCRDYYSASPAQKTVDWEELKLAINNAIWMHAPETLTLKQADEAACRAISFIGECWNSISIKHGT